MTLRCSPSGSHLMGRLSSLSSGDIVLYESAASHSFTLTRTHAHTHTLFSKPTTRPLKGSVGGARCVRVCDTPTCAVPARRVIQYARSLSASVCGPRGQTDRRACNVCSLCHAPATRLRGRVLRACGYNLKMIDIQKLQSPLTHVTPRPHDTQPGGLTVRSTQVPRTTRAQHTAHVGVLL